MNHHESPSKAPWQENTDGKMDACLRPLASHRHDMLHQKNLRHNTLGAWLQGAAPGCPCRALHQGVHAGCPCRALHQGVHAHPRVSATVVKRPFARIRRACTSAGLFSVCTCWARHGARSMQNDSAVREICAHSSKARRRPKDREKHWREARRSQDWCAAVGHRTGEPQ